MNRWLRLAAAVVSMIMIGNLQYAWTLFVHPMMEAHHWKLSEVQWGFTVFIAVMTWTMPLSGWLIDRLGPRTFMSIAGILCGTGWASLSQVHSLPAFYSMYALAGLGNGFVYCCSTALGLKWFPDRRGVASGLIAAGYGSGAALLNPIGAWLIRQWGYQDTFVFTGIVLGFLIVCAGQFLKYPPMGYIAAPVGGEQSKVRRQNEQFNSVEMLRTPQFFALYVMMLMAGIGGLMAVAQAAPVARNFQVGTAALAFALSLNPLCNGAARFLWGWISDSMGREHTMATAFFLQALSLFGVVTLGRRGDFWFVLTMAMVFLTWGEIYVLFPAVLADRFGARHAASNYSFLYSTKGVASILSGGLAAVLFEKTGTWDGVFYSSSALALCSAVGALVLLRIPMPRKPALAAGESLPDVAVLRTSQTP
jgi:OFA family oxalate/formate antiporter-like MFS transporter